MSARAAHIEAVPVELARAALLHAQGLLDDPARRFNCEALGRLIDQLGFVQLDSINVVERAHHLTLHSRCDRYQQAMLSTLMEERRSIFEHWTHDASLIPLHLFPHWKRRFKRYRTKLKANNWLKQRLGARPRKIIEHVLARIEREGPLQSKDFEPANTKMNGAVGGGWWNWKREKAALEYLWWSGELTVARRINFQKVYDLTQRVFPDHHALEPSDTQSHINWACRSALERLGFASPTELAKFWNAITIAQARRWCEKTCKRGEIVEVALESFDQSPPKRAFAFPDWRQRAAAVPAAPNRIRLLCPFDPVVRDRARLQRLFNFDYRFEAFVPAPKRRYGYYVLPILEADRFIGRLNPKFHREQGELEVKGLWWEPGVKPTRMRQQMLDDALERLASFVGSRSIAR